jgi:hypothetical protein
MGVQHTYGTAGATGGGFSAQPGSLQPHFAEGIGEPRWCYQKRSPKTWRDRIGWNSLWSYGCRTGGGDVSGYSPAGNGQGLAGLDLFEPYSCDGAGTQTKRFIRGVTRDVNGDVLANAIVQGFVTATDAYVGEVTSAEDGTYILGTETLPGVQHYLVAYKAGSPDVTGATVNTLTSTNVDGS